MQRRYVLCAPLSTSLFWKILIGFPFSTFIGYQCYCKPCTLEVIVHEYLEGIDMAECAKGKLCASVEQDTPLVFRAYDKLERSSVDVRAVISIGISVVELPVNQVNNTEDETDTYSYEFEFSYPNVASGTITVYVDDVRLPSSPFQIHVVPKDCEAHFPGQKRSPDDEGVCVCREGSMEMSGTCFESGILFALIATFVIIAVMIGAVFYTAHKRNLSDQVWLVNPEELHFDEIPEVIGQGSFGVVLAAEYRTFFFSRTGMSSRNTNATRISYKRSLFCSSSLKKRRWNQGRHQICSCRKK